MPSGNKEVTKLLSTLLGMENKPMGGLIGETLNRYMHQADQASAQKDYLMGGKGFGRARSDASKFYGSMRDAEGKPYESQYGGNPKEPTGGSESAPASSGGGPTSYSPGATASQKAGDPDAPNDDPDTHIGTSVPTGEPPPGYNVSNYEWEDPEGGILGDLDAPTQDDQDAMWADRAKWHRFGDATDAGILSDFDNMASGGGWDTGKYGELSSGWGDAAKTGLYSQADDSASKNWAQMFRNRGATEEEANQMAEELASGPNKYEGTLAQFATGPGKYDDQLGTAYGSLLNKPGFSDKEALALEQKGMLSARAQADALRNRAERAAAASGNAGSLGTALAATSRDTTRGLGEQARENVLAQASQRRADIGQGGEGIQKLQSTIDARMGALEGVNAAENARRLGAMGAKTTLSGQELGRMTSAATAASDRAQNLAERKLAGLSGATGMESGVAAGRREGTQGKAGFQNAIMAGQQAGMQAGMGFQEALAARKANRLNQKMALQNQLAQQEFGATGGMGQIGSIPRESYQVGTNMGGGL